MNLNILKKMKYLKKIFESNSGKTWSQTPTHEEQLEMVENIFIDDIDAEKCDVDIDEKDHIRVYLYSLIFNLDSCRCTLKRK